MHSLTHHHQSSIQQQQQVQFNRKNEQLCLYSLHTMRLQWLMISGRVTSSLHNIFSRFLQFNTIPVECVHMSPFYLIFKHGNYYYKFRDPRRTSSVMAYGKQHLMDSFPMVQDKWTPLKGSHFNFLIMNRDLEINYKSVIEQLPVRCIPFCALMDWRSNNAVSDSSIGGIHVQGLDNPFNKSIQSYTQFCDHVLSYLVDCLKSLQHLHLLGICHGNINEFTMCVVQPPSKPLEKPKRSRSYMTSVCNPFHGSHANDLLNLGLLFIRIFGQIDALDLNRVRAIMRKWKVQLDHESVDPSAKLASDYIFRRMLCMIFYDYNVTATQLLAKYGRWIRYKSNYKRMLDKRPVWRSILGMKQPNKTTNSVNQQQNIVKLQQQPLVVPPVPQPPQPVVVVYSENTQQQQQQSKKQTIVLRRKKQQPLKRLATANTVSHISPKKRKKSGDNREVLSAIDNLVSSDSEVMKMASPTKKKKIEPQVSKYPCITTTNNYINSSNNNTSRNTVVVLNQDKENLVAVDCV
jgi:hypothetical protein